MNFTMIRGKEEEACVVIDATCSRYMKINIKLSVKNADTFAGNLQLKTHLNEDK